MTTGELRKFVHDIVDGDCSSSLSHVSSSQEMDDKFKAEAVIVKAKFDAMLNKLISEIACQRVCMSCGHYECEHYYDDYNHDDGCLLVCGCLGFKMECPECGKPMLWKDEEGRYYMVCTRCGIKV